MPQNIHARIICPYCHIPMAVADLEAVSLGGWQMRRERMSPRYTTVWEQIPNVRAG